MKKYINMTCRSCERTYVQQRSEALGQRVMSLECNWCHECKSLGREKYTEYEVLGGVKPRKKNTKQTPLQQQKLF